MIFITAKFILLLCLVLLPFILFLFNKNKIINFYFKWFTHGMCRHDSFRKFYILVLIISLILVQFVDMQASENLSSLIVKNEARNSPLSCLIVDITPGVIHLLGFLYILLFFNYKIANGMLTQLHNKRKLFWLLAVVAIIALMIRNAGIVVAENIYLLLLAAFYFPNKINKHNDVKRKSILTSFPVIKKSA